MKLLKDYRNIIIKILGLIIIFIICDIFNDYYFTNYISNKFNDFLIYIGLKEKPVEEPFVGAIFTTLFGLFSTQAIAFFISAFTILLGQWVVNLGIGVYEAVFGLLMTTIKGSWQIAMGIGDLSIFAIYLVRWIVDHVICGMKLIFTLPTCIIFYAINLIGQILYLPFRLVFYVLHFWFGFKSIYRYEKKFWKYVEEADEWFFINVGGFHFAHWPKSIRSKCFSCVRLKMEAVANSFAPVHNRLGVQLPRAVKDDVRLMGSGFERIISSFTNVFFG